MCPTPSNPPHRARRAVLVSLLAFAAGTAALRAAERAAGGVLVAPTRLVFEDGMRSGELTLIHRGTEAVSVRLETVRFEMTAEGRLIRSREDADDGALWADELLRFSPRRIELAPGESQVVRVLVRRPANLPAGEYRTHLLFRTVTASAERAGVEDPERVGLGIAITPVFGVSIPILVRHRTTPAKVEIESVSLTREPGAEGAPMLRVHLVREGSSSVYGDLVVERAGASSGRPTELASARGLAVYHPNPERWIELPLLEMPREGERFRIRYLDRGASGRELASLSWSAR